MPHRPIDVQQRVQRVHRLAGLLDDRFVIPGTRIRYGLDAVVGLLPGVGDVATAAAGIYVIVEAARLKAPKGMLVKMFVNFSIDSVFGAVPVVGDLFDVYWKSNRKNVDMLQRHLDRQSRGT